MDLINHKPAQHYVIKPPELRQCPLLMEKLQISHEKTTVGGKKNKNLLVKSDNYGQVIIPAHVLN